MLQEELTDPELLEALSEGDESSESLGEGEGKADADEHAMHDGAAVKQEQGSVEANKEDAEDAPSGLPASVQKRIDGLTAEKARLAEKLAEVEAEAKAAKESLERLAANPVTVEPTEQNPLSDVNTVEELRARVDQARAIRKWCVENLEGGVVKDKQGQEVEISPEQVRRKLAETDDLLLEHAPRRAAWLRQAEELDAEARREYPALFDAKSELFAEAVSYLKALPEIQRFPDWKLILGDAIAGRKARLAAGEKAKAKEVAKQPVERPQLAPRVAEPVAAGVSKSTRLDRKKAEARVLETAGDDAAMEQFFMAET